MKCVVCGQSEAVIGLYCKNCLDNEVADMDQADICAAADYWDKMKSKSVKESVEEPWSKVVLNYSLTLSEVRAALTEKLRILASSHRNPAIEYIGDPQNHIFIMNTKDLNDKWDLSPESYDFALQYEALIKMVESLSPDAALENLWEIIKTGRAKQVALRRITFHDAVREKLRELIT